MFMYIIFQVLFLYKDNPCLLRLCGLVVYGEDKWTVFKVWFKRPTEGRGSVWELSGAEVGERSKERRWEVSLGKKQALHWGSWVPLPRILNFIFRAIGDTKGSDRIKCASLKSHCSSSVKGLEPRQRNKLGGCCNKLLIRKQWYEVS